MSVLINMDMPTSCGNCKAFVCYKQWAGDMGDCFCGITKNDAKAKEKNADCPLVPVPPHGDLIDRDKFRNTVFIGEQCLYSWDELEDAIEYAPTIIPASDEGET